MRESLIKSTFRSCLVALGGVFGVGLALFLIALLFSTLSQENKTKLKIDTDFKQIIAPNAKGVRQEMSKSDPVILQLNIQGVIGTDKLNANRIEELLVESREGDLQNDRVKAILLNINSPGGSATDSDAIYNAIMQYKKTYQVPVYAYIDGICASGGYYIACAADKIYSRDTAIVGSIGVLFSSPFFNVTQVMEKIGVSAATISAGKDKDMLNPFRPWKEDEKTNLQSIADGLYYDFVSIVSANRPKVDREKLVSEYGANVYLARNALEYGLIDEANASRNTVLQALIKELNIFDDDYQVVYLEKKNWLVEFLTEQHASTPLSNHIYHHLDLGNGVPSELYGKPLYLYRPEY
ncbi:MAG: signal peptide peptidase SppA [Parachlamydiales bacterium]|jgi:signal peptide peptidase SppA